LTARRLYARLFLCLLAPSLLHAAPAPAQDGARLTPKSALKQSGPELERRAQSGSFFDVVGRKSAAFGYENRALEAWVYPLKIIDDFKLSFRLAGYPLEIHGPDIMVAVNARPEATTFIYSHAAFTVRQIVFAPIDEPGIIMLLDVDSVLPMTITGSFRPRLRLMWPAGLMTGYVGWDERERAYFLSEETGRFVGMLGSPAARDFSLMPYQEEPRDVPVQFVMEAPPEAMKSHFIPIVIAGGVEGRGKVKAAYDRLLQAAGSLYDANADYYRRLLASSAYVQTPDARLDKAFRWAVVGTDKGIATNPTLGTGLVAGFRTSGESERPGFAWFFGRDALWTALAINSYGDFKSTRVALDFLRKFQREDGKIPHEISQSASFIPWFTDYPYPWASADATPLYIIAHADHWRATGDLAFLKAAWDSIMKAYRFTAATDTDGNALIENTNVGHGWVEGGALYPPHEEIYMQGAWVEALRGLAEMAEALGDKAAAGSMRAAAERTRAAMEQTYWIADRGFYAFATSLTRAAPREAEPGPRRDVRQARMNEMDKARLIDEQTVLPAVPLWWRTLDVERAQSQIDHLGSGAMATDWGARIISSRSKLYDPLSYHYGSVWPLFTGWASMGAYRYGRPHVGYQALMANALLTYANALGYVTELLSGDFNMAFGRSSHHQVWSEAMVVTPVMRGLFGIEATDAGRALSFAPQLPADWDRAAARNVAAGGARYDLAFERAAGRVTIRVTRLGQSNEFTGAARLIIAPAFPLDAQVRAVTVNGRAAKFSATRSGDVQRAEVVVDSAAPAVEVVFACDEGSDVYAEHREPSAGAASQGLRVLRSRADAGALRVLVEGLGGRSYQLGVRTTRRTGEVAGARWVETGGRDRQLLVNFEGPTGGYVRRELIIPLLQRR
jgi:glycogen debranching enzyme